jgi:hypothetical protein
MTGNEALAAVLRQLGELAQVCRLLDARLRELEDWRDRFDRDGEALKALLDRAPDGSRLN